MTTLEVLVGARAKIAQGFTTKAYARNKDGLITLWGADDAVCWCSRGAILSVAALAVEIVPAEIALKTAMATNRSLVDWSDSHTQEEVLAAFDRAIEQEKAGA